MTPWAGLTCADALRIWDDRKPIWMYRLGEGEMDSYEADIYILAMELLRAVIGHDLTDMDAEKWRALTNSVNRSAHIGAVIERIKPDTSQFFSAASIVTVFARLGYARALDTMEDSDRVLIKKGANIPDWRVN